MSVTDKDAVKETAQNTAPDSARYRMGNDEAEIRGFLDFIAASPSSYHAAHELAAHFSALGFAEQDETSQWSAAPGGHFLVRGGAFMAWWVPEGASASSGFKIVGSHTDSPGLSVKPNPDFTAAGWQQAAVEVYGGPLLHTWFDRDLTIAGQVVDNEGEQHLVRLDSIARLPSLAIHLYRKDALEPDRQAHMQPVLAANDPDVSLLAAVGVTIGKRAEEVAAFNLITADAQRGEIIGASANLLDRFIAAGRMDNLASVYSSLVALTAAVEDYSGTDILVMAAFDHEEVGSASRYGAAGPILEDVLVRIAHALGANEEQRLQMYARSSCISVDAAHSVHPNYAGKHDPTHHPIIGRGPVTKVNANQRYASDASSVALWERACALADVPVQRFVGNNDVPCGSTIGPITATRLGIETVDVGIPLLSMHSAREMAGVGDQLWMSQALKAYLAG